CGNQDQRRRVVHEPLTAAVRSLQSAQEQIQPIEVDVRISVVPDAQREQGEQVEKVVVEQDREHGGVDRAGASQLHHIVQDVNGDGIGEDAVGFAVPIVQHVKAVAARLLVVRLDDGGEVDGL